MKIIGFSGKMGAGKSTAIECLKDVQNGLVELVKFAEPLYDIQEYAYRRIKSVHARPGEFIKDRKLLQFLGTDWGRNTISDTIWLDLWKQEVINIKEHEHEEHIIVVCDDVRFDNEAALIKSMGGVVIQINSDKSSERINTALSNHSSENGIDLKYIDAIIENNGTVQDLRDSLLTLNTMKQLW